MEKFWAQYRTCPLVRRGIDIFAEDITAPGYRVDADNDELVEELEEWLSSSAIVAGESHRDFAEILDGSIVQEEVRGTALVEVVPKAEADDEIWGFRLINVSTVSAYTYENQAVLIRPDDTEVDGVQTTSRGEAAAYGQWDNSALAGPFNDKNTVPLSQNDIVKLVRDPDTSDIFGNSSIEPVSQEIDELYRMLDDIGEAVHSKGYPHWIFKLGEPSGDITDPRAGVWPEDKIKDYRDEHKEGNWEVGSKDFVPGDVEVETISSDVPEIEELLDWYVEEIVSTLPVPKYKLGFTDSINRDVTAEQAPQYERKIENKRRQLEEAFTPVLRRKAEEFGYSENDVASVKLSIEEEREENPLLRDNFDASEFAEFARGLQAAAGDEGEPSDIVPPEEMRELLGLPDRDEVEESALEEELDEENEQVQAQFEELYGEPSTPDAMGDGADFDLDTSNESEPQAPTAD
ncbi:phage portal protein [Halalkaliarchaeum desulfuricum]|uniref:phage portal protein n=1 Tax=Halalkaliarchaeum desulfuricum TaxID=2055893 RepID=UPI001379D94B|nr:phage portal protein [Halalkaliarchaeum desulfuricum]